MEFPNYYNILELDRKASPEQIWLSYHRLAFLERQKKEQADMRRLFWLEEAYEALIYPEIKQKYDSAYDRYLFLKMPFEFRRKIAVFMTGFLTAVILFIFMHIAFQGHHIFFFK
jgi:DnaJ-class molecular chaperone